MRNKWRVWRPAAEIVAFVGVIVLVFYATGEHAPSFAEPDDWRTYTVCDIASGNLREGARVRLIGVLAGDHVREPTLHHWSCADRWLAFDLTDEALASSLGRELAAAIEAQRRPALVPGAPGYWKGSFRVLIEGRVSSGDSWGEFGVVEVEQVRSWRYLGDGVGLDWEQPSPESSSRLTWAKARRFWERCRGAGRYRPC